MGGRETGCLQVSSGGLAGWTLTRHDLASSSIVLTTSTTTRTSSASSPRPDTGVHVVCTRTYVCHTTMRHVRLHYVALFASPSTSSRPVPPPPPRPAGRPPRTAALFAGRWLLDRREGRNTGPAPRRDKRSRVARSIACVAPIDDSSESSRIRRRRQQCRSGTVFYCWLLCPGKQALCRLRSCMRLRVCVPGPARKGRRRDAAMRNRRQAAS